MQVTGIISEFNPFHRGHTVPIQAARTAMGGEGAVVCIMSGNCVQRGDLAVFRKTARAEAAIRCGADLVAELPVPYVLSSAERFAEGGVALLAAMGQADTRLAFGCETADAEVLTAAAHALNTPQIQANIKAKMGGGLPYGTACQTALDAVGDLGAPLRTPNNLLAIEYLRAIHRLGADITPLTVQRKGATHDSDTPTGGYASATHLRERLRHRAQCPHCTLCGIYKDDAVRCGHRTLQKNDPWDYMPAAATELFRRELANGYGPVSLTHLEPAILTLLRLNQAPEGGWSDDSEGLSTRIKNIAAEVGSLQELLDKTKTKRYHLSRIRRLILTMCLGLTPTHRPQVPPYIRVLAANQTGQALLRRVTKTASLPILSRPAEVKRLGETAIQIFTKESAVTDLMALCFAPHIRQGGSEWRAVPYISACSATPNNL
ncbi:MAG: nucleotidyltransferase family protein [Oscillospiraceae bacterium]|nr:nucleotidyltransferase family protein [Oscillospiraceae bacterium]